MARLKSTILLNFSYLFHLFFYMLYPFQSWFNEHSLLHVIMFIIRANIYTCSLNSFILYFKIFSVFAREFTIYIFNYSESTFKYYSPAPSVV